MKDQQSEQKTAEELLIAKNAATKEIFHMPFEKAFIRIIVGDTNFTMSQVESVIDKTALLYASQQTASLQKQYNDLGVKYGKELERWIERDEEQREEIEKWKNLYEAERDINLQAIVTEQQQEIEYLQKQLEEQREKLADLANTIRSKNNTLDEYEEEIERLKYHLFQITEWFDVGCYVDDNAQIMIIEAQKALQSPPGESEKENNNHGKK